MDPFVEFLRRLGLENTAFADSLITITGTPRAYGPARYGSRGVAGQFFPEIDSLTIREGLGEVLGQKELESTVAHELGHRLDAIEGGPIAEAIRSSLEDDRQAILASNYGKKVSTQRAAAGLDIRETFATLFTQGLDLLRGNLEPDEGATLPGAARVARILSRPGSIFHVFRPANPVVQDITRVRQP